MFGIFEDVAITELGETYWDTRMCYHYGLWSDEAIAQAKAEELSQDVAQRGEKDEEGNTPKYFVREVRVNGL